ncbi:MAG: division/cell wall cluster transcriptional repressor MraZ [Candidatus Omnitrophica bacterium]|nr:division/cell wall cluster transcriptional repressor MraZ [Candidatus Omnitrophota bacterium]MCB9747793.1 division/cell wall cluster transcriptional repressor MraZ [Candidatus Omnitrophota bacterium]
MFYGEYNHGIDRKGRLILPAKFRDVCKDCGIERFFITRGLDKCIFMFTEEEWRSQEQKFKNMPFTKQETRSFNRMFFSGAVDVMPDRQGRFIVPQYLKDYANIKKEAVVIGVANRIEIWDKKTWETFFSNSSETFEQIAENMMNL